MLYFEGRPKSSALFYWTNNSITTCKKPYFASFFTISPVELQEAELAKADKLNFMYPIMIHEPIPVNNLEKVVQEARERNATIVNCGPTSIRDIRTQMRKTLAEYLNSFISQKLEIDEIEEKINLDLLKDINFKKLKKKLSQKDTRGKIEEITQLTGAIRAILKSEQMGDRETLEYMTGEIEKLRLDNEYDFDQFLHIVKKPGKIAHKISELYIRQFYNISTEDRSKREECREDIDSLFTLRRLDELRKEARSYINNNEPLKAIQSIEQICKIKESDPPFCSSDDLDCFCNDLTEAGSMYDELTNKYIEKYFLVINKKFNEAGKVHKEICTIRNST